MGNFIDDCKNAITGMLNGFDRIVFQGKFRSLQFAEGVERFLADRGILFKDAKNWNREQTQRIIDDVEHISKAETGRGISPIASSRTRKEDLARERQRSQGIDSGLIGAWSCVEEAVSYRIRPAKGRPKMLPERVRCKHLYLYIDDPTFGFMSIRLQTWMPFMIQIALNGREWLSRSLHREGIAHQRYQNKIIACDDYARAQALLDRQAQRTSWPRVLRGFVPIIFPSLDAIVGPDKAYTWYGWQSEWATDLIFPDVGTLHQHVEGVMQHAFATQGSTHVMRFFDKATNADGRLRRNANPGIISRTLGYGDGMRLRHWLEGNSVKIYNQLNVMRIETTINNPGRFKTVRPSGSDGEPRARPMRKDVCDMPMRAKVSDSVNTRVLNSLERRTGEKVGSILGKVTKEKTVDGRHSRGLRPFDKDLPLIQAIAKQEWMLTGFCNAEIRAQLRKEPRFRDKTDKQLAGYVTRMIRLLRDHGLIRKYPRQHRYQLNAAGRQLTDAVQATLAADISALLREAA